MTAERNQYTLRAIPLLVAACLVNIPAQAQYSGGSGTADDPYQIATAADLIALGENPDDYDKHFILTADIDLSGITWSEAVVPMFAGTFDGNGRCIRNLTIAGRSRLGLFGEIMQGAHVKNVAVVNVNVVGSEARVGGLVGVNDGIVTNCYSTGVVAGNFTVGGLIGLNDSGSVSNCYSTGSVSGDGTVGGLVGENRASIANCYASSVVLGGKYGIGGLVGDNWRARDISNSYWDVGSSGVVCDHDSMGLSTGEMQDLNTFLDAGWDFVGERRNGTSEIWMMPPGGGYPVLSAFHGYRPAALQGQGTANDPYLLSSAADLGAVVWYNPAAHCRLAANIDLSGIRWSTAIIPGFSGVFDGNDPVIRNLTATGGNFLGLFGTLGADGRVRNTGVVDANVTSTGWYVGGLAGFNYGTVVSCYSTGEIAAISHVGGLVGYNGGDASECHSASSIAGSNAGGLVGYHSGSVRKSFSSGTVAGLVNVGGLVGRAYADSVIEDCHSTGDVQGEYYYVGGLVGSGLLGYVARSFSAGTVTGVEDVGGLVGGDFGNIIEDCYSRSAVSGQLAVGGLMGDSVFGSVARCYSTGPIMGSESCGGLLGYGGSSIVVDSFWDIETSGCTISEGGTGLTSAGMQMAQTFLGAGWDFVDETENGSEDIWWIDEGQDYPRLWWESKEE